MPRRDSLAISLKEEVIRSMFRSAGYLDFAIRSHFASRWECTQVLHFAHRNVLLVERDIIVSLFRHEYSSASTVALAGSRIIDNSPNNPFKQYSYWKNDIFG